MSIHSCTTWSSLYPLMFLINQDLSATIGRQEQCKCGWTSPCHKENFSISRIRTTAYGIYCLDTFVHFICALWVLWDCWVSQCSLILILRVFTQRQSSPRKVLVQTYSPGSHPYYRPPFCVKREWGLDDLFSEKRPLGQVLLAWILPPQCQRDRKLPISPSHHPGSALQLAFLILWPLNRHYGDPVPQWAHSYSTGWPCLCPHLHLSMFPLTAARRSLDSPMVGLSDDLVTFSPHLGVI